MDVDGKVLINIVQKVMFIFKVSKQVIVDPIKMSSPVFASMACKFEYFNFILIYLVIQYIATKKINSMELLLL